MPETLSQLNLYNVLIIIFVVSFSSFLLTFGYSIYYWLHKRHQKHPGKTVDPRDVAVTEAVKIVDQARSKAMELLKEAHYEAKTILHESEEVQTSTKELFEQKMQQVAQKQMQAFDELADQLLDAYTTVLHQEKETSLKSLMDVSSAMKQELTGQVSSFAESLKEVTNQTESTIKNDLLAKSGQVSEEMTRLAESLKTITAEAEENMKTNLGDQYQLVQNEIGSLSANIKRVTDEAESTIKGELMGQYEQLKNEVGGLSESLRHVTEETENKIKEDINKEYEEAKGVVHQFADSLRQATVETEKTLKQDVQNEYRQIKTELENYKKQRMDHLDKTMNGMLEEVARDVLGKIMNSKDHEEFIVRSLDNIKRSTNFKDL